MENIYRQPEAIQRKVAEGQHRALVGGIWDTLGQWQLRVLKQQGLAPHHHVLDVGCGSLRGGVHLVDYLEADHYAGVDAHQALLDAGYDVELADAGLQHKVDRSKLVETDRFDFSSLAPGYDVALAQSLFTHLDWNHIRLCLHNLVSVMRPGGRLFATYFEAPEELGLDRTIDRGEGICTAFERNPYHYRFSDLAAAARGLPMSVARIGDVGHPRGQFMAEFDFVGG